MLSIEHLDVDATLNCTMSCTECTRIVPGIKKFGLPDAEPKDIYNDLSILSRSVHAEWGQVIGGEPTLHKDLLGCLKATRDSGVSNKILFTTNGTTINNISDELIDNVDMIRITLYPNKTDPCAVDNFENRVKSRGKTLDKIVVKTFSPIFSNDKNDNINLSYCWQYKNCFTYYYGFFYVCSTAVSINALTHGKRIDGINLRLPSAEKKVYEHITNNVVYDACHYCHLAMPNKQTEWGECQSKDWLLLKKL